MEGEVSFSMRVMVVSREGREGWRRTGWVPGASLVAHELHEALGGEGLWPLDGQAQGAVPDE